MVPVSPICHAQYKHCKEEPEEAIKYVVWDSEEHYGLHLGHIQHAPQSPPLFRSAQDHAEG